MKLLGSFLEGIGAVLDRRDTDKTEHALAHVSVLSVSRWFGTVPITSRNGLSLTDFWTKVVTQRQVLFLNFNQEAPVVHCVVTVPSDLSLAVYVVEMRLQDLGSSVLSSTV